MKLMAVLKVLYDQEYTSQYSDNKQLNHTLTMQFGLFILNQRNQLKPRTANAIVKDEVKRTIVLVKPIGMERSCA